MLLALGRHGCLTNGQASELLFCDAPNSLGEPRSDRAARAAANRVLQALWHGGYVERRRAVLTSRQGFPYLHFVNVLTDQGAAAVATYHAETGQTQPFTWTGPPALGHQQLEHTVALTDLYTLLARACRRRGVTFGLWHDDRRLAGLHREGQTRFVSIPDAFFGLQHGSGPRRTYFVELDLGTETVFGVQASRRDWRGKIAGYEQYLRQHYGRQDAFEGLPAPTVLTVTTSAERLANLIAATTAAGGSAERYWFTTRDALDPEGVTPRGETLWQPIWAAADHRPRHLTDQLAAR